MGRAVGEGLRTYYKGKIEELELLIKDKGHNLRRLEAQRNELNAHGWFERWFQLSLLASHGQATALLHDAALTGRVRHAFTRSAHAEGGAAVVARAWIIRGRGH